MHKESFWTTAYPAFMSRDITRDDMRHIVRTGLEQTHGSYRLLLGLFTHFFGVVLAAAMLVGLAAHRLYVRRPLAPLAILGAALALAAVGLVPFAKASAEISAVSERNRVYEVVQLLYRLVAHPAMATHRVVALVALAVPLAGCRSSGSSGSPGPAVSSGSAAASGTASAAAVAVWA